MRRGDGQVVQSQSFGDAARKTGTIEVVSRSFEVLRCFSGLTVRLGNGDLATRIPVDRGKFARTQRSACEPSESNNEDYGLQIGGGRGGASGSLW
jgi:hypothetical protein